jgi:hypothetical protein
MCRILVVGILLLCLNATAFAGLPDPSRSGCGLKGQSAACQYRFRADGGLDRMTVCVTLRDPFDNPVENCETRTGINFLGPKPFDPACPYAPEGAGRRSAPVARTHRRDSRIPWAW